MIRTVTTLGLIVFGWAATAVAGDSCLKPHGWCEEPCVEYVSCRPIVKCEPIELTCYEVECKQICIPAVTLPWQKCCEPKCGKIITVNRLKETNYECGERFVCEWVIEPCKPCESCKPVDCATALDAPVPSAPAPSAP